MKIGIVGLPNVGKSTLFNALTKHSVPAENYPFCTIDPTVGIVPVPDDRLEELSNLSKSKETIPAVVEFVDIAGLVKGASKGEGLGNKFLSNVREVDAIAQVVRVFDDEEVHHVHGSVEPIRDIEVINLELSMADLSTVTKRIERLEKEIKAGNKDAKTEEEILEKFEEALDKGELISELDLNKEERQVAKNLNLLTAKKFLYVLNRKSGSDNLDILNDDRYTELMEFLEDRNFVVVDAGVENELKDLDEEEKNTYRMELIKDGDDVYEGGLGLFVKKGYEILNLITFFTTGEKETRAWTTKEGSTAPEAGRAIHSDFHDKFIRAEVINWRDLIEVGSKAIAREKGLLRTEGKDYVVKDGDVIEFKI